MKTDEKNKVISPATNRTGAGAFPAAGTSMAATTLIAALALMLMGIMMASCSSDSSPPPTTGIPCNTYFDCEFGYSCINNFCVENATQNPNPNPNGDNNLHPDAGIDTDLDLDTSTSTWECADDPFMGNHSLESAHPVAAGTTTGLVICGDLHDWFTMNVAGSSTITIIATFEDGLSPNHHLTLYRENGSIMTTGQQEDNRLKISTNVQLGGNYLIQVGINNNVHSTVAHRYNLSIAVSTTGGGTTTDDRDTGVNDQDGDTGSGGEDGDKDTGITQDQTDTGSGQGGEGNEPKCVDDQYAGNHTSQLAATIGPGTHPSLVICDNNNDWFMFQVGANDTIKVSVEFSNGNSDLGMNLHDGHLARVARATPAGGRTIKQLTHVATSSDYYFVQVYKEDGPDTGYTLTLQITPPEPVYQPCRTIIRCIVNECTNNQACEAQCIGEGSEESMQEAQDLLNCIDTETECTDLLPEECWSETCAPEKEACFPKITGNYTCREIVICNQLYCEADDWVCHFECLELGTEQGQRDITALNACLTTHCLNPDGSVPYDMNYCANEHCKAEYDTCELWY